MNSFQNVLLYCRAGFEPECAQEIEFRAGEFHLYGYCRLTKASGFVEFCLDSHTQVQYLLSKISLYSLIFCRQWTIVSGRITDLNRENRVGPILDIIQRDNSFIKATHLSVDCPESETTASLKTFCRKFTAPMARALRDHQLLKPKKTEKDYLDKYRIVLFFTTFEEVFVGYQIIENSSRFHLGIPRLKFPLDAPSRSTLKLEEAWHYFLSKEHWYDDLGGGLKAVDLGAAPGGWTWQLVKEGMDVIAVDNGSMNDKLMATEQVVHVKEDGFIYEPSKPVDWLVCDIVDKPMRVIQLIAKWAGSGWCRFSVFNLKLPMKKRYSELAKCLDYLESRLQESGLRYQVACKQLYHDREEVTCFLRLL